MSLINEIFYRINSAWVQALVFLCTKRDIKGRENVPREGPLIVVSNHMNNADPPVLEIAIPRNVRWLTKAEWFKTPVIGWLFKLAGMIPVKRFEADLHALREAQKLLDRGGCLGMFPEGTRSKGKGLKTGEPGSALIALRSGAPILPIALWGTENVRLPRDIFGRTRVHMRIGKPFVLRPANPKKVTREDIAAGTHQIMATIAEMLPEKFRGVYASPDRAAAEKQTA
jgi:1-acyl-sn-glycerol-3-phosphate acyltransferase